MAPDLNNDFNIDRLICTHTNSVRTHINLNMCTKKREQKKNTLHHIGMVAI